MKRIKTRVLSAFLATVMVFLMIPIGNIGASAEKDGMWYYRIEDGAATIIDIVTTTATTRIDIPSSIGGYPVTKIESGVLSSNGDATAMNIEIITIPSTVVEIGNDTFSCNYSLEKVTIDGNNLKTIGRYAFQNCYKMKTINLPRSVTSIGDYAFSYCSALESISIPSVTNMGTRVFQGCTSLKTLEAPFTVILEYMFAGSGHIPSTLNTIRATGTRIVSNAFYECDSITSVTIASTVTSVGADAFYGCGAVETVSGVSFVGNWLVDCTSSSSTLTVRDGTVGIADSAFADRTALSTVTIPKSVKYIPTSAFANKTVKIRCYSGSAAYDFAVANGYTYELIKDNNTTTPVVPVIDSKDDTSITLHPYSGFEYRVDGGAWQSSNVFTDLVPHQEYTFEQRVAETDTKYASVISSPLTATTNGHLWGEGAVTTPPTHTEKGVTTYYCTDDECDATKTEDIPELTEHTYDSYEKYDETQHKLVCVCGESQYAPHTWDDGVVTTQPTIVSEGVKTYTCTDCTETKTEAVPKIIDENAPTVVIDSTRAFVGKTVTVNVSLKNNPGIASMKLYLTYDTDVLTLKSVTYNSALGGMSQQPQSMTSPVILNWFNGSENTYGDMVYATLVFDVKETAVTGESTKITATYDAEDVYNISETNITFAVTDGELDIVSYVLGDINGDEVVNNKDVTRLFQYLSEWDVEVNTAALDVNGDGSVNNKDLTRLFQFVSDWDVEIF